RFTSSRRTWMPVQSSCRRRWQSETTTPPRRWPRACSQSSTRYIRAPLPSWRPAAFAWLMGAAASMAAIQSTARCSCRMPETKNPGLDRGKDKRISRLRGLPETPSGHLEVLRRCLAAITHELEFYGLAFIERAQPRALHGRDMDKDVLIAGRWPDET